MNILIINPILHTPEKGKIKVVATIKHTMIYNFALGFLKLGHKVSLLAAEDYRPGEKEQYDFPVIFLPTIFKWLPKGFPVFRGLKAFLREHACRFDMIISSEVFSYASFIASWSCPEKLVIWHEMGQHAPTLCKLPSKLWYNMIGKYFFRKILIIPRSEVARNFISLYCPVVGKPVDHGINIDKFQFCAEKEKYFIVVAQLIPRKNIGSIIRKFAAFEAKYEKGFRLLIAGDGPLKEDLQNLSEQSGEAKKIELLGQLTQGQLIELLEHASALLIDTFYDYNMVSIPEAICCGTPILTNMKPYLAVYINTYQLGKAKEEWDEDDLYTFLDHLYEYRENCKSIRNTLSNTYLCNQMVEEFLKYSSNENTTYQ